jgi:hypothetical protein
VKVAAGESWVPLDEYVSLKSTVLFSHTFCPDHVPSLM